MGYRAEAMRVGCTDQDITARGRSSDWMPHGIGKKEKGAYGTQWVRPNLSSVPRVASDWLPVLNRKWKNSIKSAAGFSG